MPIPISKKLRPAVAAATADAAAQPVRPAGRAAARSRRVALPRPRPELVALLALAGVLNLWALSRNGWANEYYSAAVRSMSSSLHAFLYGSFDANGVMTVDKPPLALWVQVLSVKLFGFNSLSILVPQALMGMATVGLVYDLVRRRFGRLAGLIGGLVLATTPMTVAISRHNNPDALLVLCSTAAVWALVRGLEDGRTRWLVLSGLCVGLGFETKMGVALMVVPGIVGAWLWVAPRGRGAALRQLLAGGAVTAAVGLAWPVLVWLTPAASRPWVSGTGDNSIWSLIFGYNGLGRLDGQAGGPQAFGGAGPFGGSTGPFRLLNASLGGQAGWLLGFALVGGLAILLASRLRRSDRRSGWAVVVGGAFLTSAVAFSFAQGIFHPYYVSLLAPFTAALVGGGAAQLVRGGPGARILTPLAVAAGVAGELAVVHANGGSPSWVPPLVIVAGVAACAALAAPGAVRMRRVALAVALAALIAAPTVWAAQTLGHAISGTFPAGGPASASSGFPGGPGRFARGGRPFGPGRFGLPPGAAGGAAPGGFGPPPRVGALPPAGAPAGGLSLGRGAGLLHGRGGFGGPFGGERSLSAVLRYAKQHGGGAVAVSSQQAASAPILSSGADVVALGGFSGRESEVSPAWFANAVSTGKVRWVIVDRLGAGGGPFRRQDRRAGSSKLMAAVGATCRRVPSSAYGGGSTGGTLYDCSGRAAALQAYAAR